MQNTVLTNGTLKQNLKKYKSRSGIFSFGTVLTPLQGIHNKVIPVRSSPARDGYRYSALVPELCNKFQALRLSNSIIDFIIDSPQKLRITEHLQCNSFSYQAAARSGCLPDVERMFSTYGGAGVNVHQDPDVVCAEKWFFQKC